VAHSVNHTALLSQDKTCTASTQTVSHISQ